MKEIFSSSEFWRKVAMSKAADDGPIIARDQEEMLRGFLEHFKEAGANPFDVLGLMYGIAEQFVPLEKEAGQKWDAFKNFWNPTEWGNNDGSTTLGDFVPFRSAGQRVSQQIADGTRDLPENINNDYSWLAEGMREKNPNAMKMLDGLFNDPEKASRTALHFSRGEYGKGLGNVWDGVTSAPAVEKWAPYVVPGLAAMGAGRMMGLGWGGSAALGVGGALLGNAAWTGGGISEMISKWNAPAAAAPAAAPAPATAAAGNTTPPAQPAPAAGSTPPAAPATPAPAPTPQAQAQVDMNANQQNATNIGQQAVKPANLPPAPAPAPLPPTPTLPKVGALSPTQFGGLIGAGTGIIGGGLVGAAMPGGSALTGAAVGGLAGAAGGAAGANIGSVSIKDMIVGRRNAIEKVLGRPASMQELIFGE